MNFLELLKSIVLILALTMDSFMVSFAYGASRTKMSVSVIIIMNLVMCALLGIAILTGNCLTIFLSETLTGAASFLLLFFIGLYRICSCFRNHKEISETNRVSYLGILEGIGLAAVLSLDSIAVGVGTGLVQERPLFLVIGSFFMGVFMMETGWSLGTHFRTFFKQDLSWIGGVCLILLAVSTLR
ncbi:MAG: manganese efflux pump MntP family protein [Blautia sp.]